MPVRRSRGTRRSGKGTGGVSHPSRSKTQRFWDDVGERINVSYDVLGHPQQASRPVEESKHYTVLAYTDWADTMVPTVIQWNHGAVDSFTDPRKSQENQRKALQRMTIPELKKGFQAMKKAAEEEKEKWGKPGPMTLKDLRYYQAELKKAREKTRSMSHSIKLPIGGGTLKVGSKEYVWRTGDRSYEAAQEKAGDLRSRGHKAVIRKELVAGRPTYVVYARKEEGAR